MESLADLWSLPAYPARWRVQKADPVTYQLWQDPRAAQELERILAADRRHVGARLQKLVELSNLPGDETPPKTGDPVLDLAFFSDNQWRLGVRPAARMLGDLPAGAQSAVLAGNNVWLPFERWSPNVQGTLLSGVLSTARRTFTGPAGESRRETDLEALTRFRQSSYGLRFDLDPDDQNWKIVVSQMAPEGDGSISYGFPLGPLGVSQVSQDAREPSDALNARTLEKSLAQAVSAGTAWKEFTDFQRFLAQQTGLVVVSDYYHDKPAPDSRGLAEAKALGELLRRATTPPRYRWWSDSEVLLFRNRRWFLDDLDEVPATLEIRLTTARARRGHLHLDELGEAGKLNEKQARRLARVIPGFENAYAYRRLLAWYAALSETQKRAVQAPSGLRVSDSPIRARGFLFHNGANVEPLLAAVGEPRVARVSMRQEQRVGALDTLIDVIAPSGSSVRYRFTQKIVPVVEGSVRPEGEDGDH